MNYDERWEKIVADYKKSANYNATGKGVISEPTNSVGRKRIKLQPRYELCGKVRGKEAIYC